LTELEGGKLMGELAPGIFACANIRVTVKAKQGKAGAAPGKAGGQRFIEMNRCL
jgi:hypothetical protein